jgi:hypothetical protein
MPVAEGFFPDAPEQTLVASGVYTTRTLWTNDPGTDMTYTCDPAQAAVRAPEQKSLRNNARRSANREQ